MTTIHFCTCIPKPMRVDIYISALFLEFSRSYIQKCIDEGDITVNGLKIKKNLKIYPRDEIVFSQKITSWELVAEDIPLDIIYEDENILIINKDPGINVHPTPGIEGKKWTLVNALLFHCKNALPVISGEERPGIVHRLDKDTSGAIMVAKNDMMMHYLSNIIQKRNIKKYYYAVTVWIMGEKHFTISSDIGRCPYDRTKMTINNPLNPKKALTHGRVLGYFWDKYTLLEIDLETGRTHQIRVHLASIGYPILWDKIYGNMQINIQAQKEYGVTRQMLHAHRLELQLYGMNKSFIAPLKKDMQIFFL